MSQDTAPTTQVQVEEDGHKVFVGNLSFQTTEEQLAELFSKPTPVLKAKIITRGTRSLGFGFVAYETLIQAEEAAQALNKTELDGREINVEIARPRVERAPIAPKEKTPRQPKGENKDVAEAGDADEVKPRTGRSSRSRANRKNRNKARNEGEEGTSEEVVAATNGEEKEASASKEGAGRRKRTNRRRKTATTGDNWTDDAAAAAAPAAPSRRSAPRQAGPPSKNTVFVANLPFSMEDEGLKELFAGFKVVSAHVVRHRDSGRSKGFGFVELEDEAEQQNVLEKMKDVESDGRELVIKVALSEQQISAEKEADETKATEESA